MDPLAHFIPMDRRQALAHGADLPAQAEGTVLFADLAGYTALSEVLAADDPIAAGDRLRQALAPLFATLITDIHTYGGTVLGFAGDAATAWFPTDTGHRAVTAAAAIQATVPTLPPLRLPDGTLHPLAFKIVVTAGPVRRFLAGDPAHGLFDVLAGPPLARAALGDHLATGGEILLDEPAAAALPTAAGTWRTDPEDGTRFLALTSPPPPATPAPWPPLPPEALSPTQTLAWVPAAARPRLTADPTFLPELRPAVPLFLRFSGLDYSRPTAAPRLDAYIRWVQGVLAAYGGSLLQLTVGDKGTCLYAAFGVPVAHGDAAARAAAAALVLRTPPPACPYIVGVQIGLASGSVYAGPSGSPASATYGALGTCVNLAARLMDAAGPGSILATRAVRRAAGPRFAWTALPPLLVKGEAAPVPVYGLIGAASRDTAAGGGAPLVGRAAELASVQALLERARTGQGHLVGLIGEAGLGKSRLVAAVARAAAADGWAIYPGAAPSYGIATPYLAWQGVWRAFFDLDPTGTPAEQALDLADRLAALAPALLPRLPLLGPALGLALPETDLTASMEPALRTESRVALLIDCLRARAALTPVLLVLEDAHWLDALSHELLEAVGRAIPAAPVVVLLAYRPPELEHLQAVRVESLPHFTALRLGGLATGDAAALVTARLTEQGGRVPPGEWIATLVARAAGNPFYLEELVTYALEQGLDLADATARARLAWPTSLQSLLLARLDQLTEPARQVLKVGSVVGARFPVAHLWGVHPDLGAAARVMDDLWALAAAELVLPEGGVAEPAYRFKHAVTQEVTYGTLPGTVRARLHGQFGAWLEAVGASVELLAYHYERSSNGGKAREYLRRAGDLAAADGAFAAAAGHYNALLGRLEPGDPARGPVLVARGDARVVLGAWAEAGADYAAARAVAGVPGAVRAAAARGLGEVCGRQGTYDAAIRWLEMALEEYAALGDGAGEARALADRGWIDWLRGEYGAARAVLTRAGEQATAAGAPGVRALALHNLGNVAGRQGDYAAARALYAESLAGRRDLGDRAGIATSLHNLGAVAWYQGDYDAARALYAESLALKRELGDRAGIADSLNNLGVVAASQGDYELERALTTESLAVARELGDRAGIATSLNGLGVVAHRQGDYPAARALYTESLALRRDLGDRARRAYSLNNLGLVAHRQGDDAAARAYLAESLALAPDLGPGETTQWALALAAVLLPPPPAAEVLGALAALLAAQHGHLEPLYQQAQAQAVVQAQAALGAAAYAQAFAAGQALDWTEAVARVRAALVPERLRQAKSRMSV